jgi:16S rRNA G966 N2-methylase RsmD
LNNSIINSILKGEDIDYPLPRIEDPDNLSSVQNELRTSILSSGKSLTYPVYLNGGADRYKKYFLNFVKDKQYNNAFEWCAGHGELGFELITNGICKTLAFSDCYSKSTEWCLKNAEYFGLQDKVTAYTSDTIGNIPFEYKFDLVISNPPNSMDIDETHIKKYFNGFSDDDLIQYLRINTDFNFTAHKEFFDNLYKCTTSDVDILITGHIGNSEIFKNLSIRAGFEQVEIIDMNPDDPSLKIYHYKPIRFRLTQ